MVNLDELRELVSEASPGPWDADNDEGYSQWKVRANDGEGYLVVVGDSAKTDANARMVEAALNAMPALLAELQAARDLRSAVDSLTSVMPVIRSHRLYNEYHNVTQALAAYDKAVRDAE
jgi:hypothetical protein